MRKRKPVHPGIVIEEHYIKPLNISKSDLADTAKISRNTLYKILKGESRITASMALRLSKALKTTPELWLNLQQKYDIWEAEHDKSLQCANIKPIISLVARAHA